MGRGATTMQMAHALPGPVWLHERLPDKGPAFAAGSPPKHHTLLLRQRRAEPQNSLHRLPVAPLSGPKPELVADALATVGASRSRVGAQVLQSFLHLLFRHFAPLANWV